MPGVHALVPAAGSGTRFAVQTEKLFVPVAGRPVLGWTLDALLGSPSVSSVTVALSAERFDDGEANRALLEEGPHRLRFVVGGSQRQDSVERCLAVCPARGDDLVLVHDGGRPCLAREDLERVLEAALEHGAAVLGRPVTDTIKRVRGGRIVATVDRTELFRAETPQAVRRRDLERALARARQAGVRATDEAGLLEGLEDVEVRAVEARFPNPKLTVPADLELVEQILRRRQPRDRRVG